jgi:predicted permease
VNAIRVWGFVYLPIVAAIVGLAYLREKSLWLVVLAFMIPCVVMIAGLQLADAHFGNWHYAALPRVSYISYPAIYLLAALGLREGCGRLFVRRPRWATVGPYVFLAAVFVLNNIDVLGVPAIYYYFGCGAHGYLPFGEAR